MAEKENLDIPMILTVAIVSVVLTVVAVIGVQALFYSYESVEEHRKVIALPTNEANSKLAEQEARLARYGWADREKGQVVIPIERAMTLTVKDFNQATASVTLPVGSSAGTTREDSL